MQRALKSLVDTLVRMVNVLVQRSAEVGAPGLVNFITAVAYHFCLSLAAAFTQPGASTSAVLCTCYRIDSLSSLGGFPLFL